jgi:hypothetical protein
MSSGIGLIVQGSIEVQGSSVGEKSLDFCSSFWRLQRTEPISKFPSRLAFLYDCTLPSCTLATGRPITNTTAIHVSLLRLSLLCTYLFYAALPLFVVRLYVYLNDSILVSPDLRYLGHIARIDFISAMS